MTATRDRRSDLDTDPGPSSWGERPAFGSRAVPWWGAVLLALVLTLAGTVVDLKSSGSLGWIFKVTYVLGCVLGVILVKRRSLFGPMVQPPLIMAVVAAPVLVLLSGGSAQGLIGKAMAVGTPLIGNFPVMAVATVLTLVIGAIRLILQRKPVLDDDEDDRRPVRRPEPPTKAVPPRGAAPRPAGAKPRPPQPSPRERERIDRERPDRADRDRQPPQRGGTGGRGAPGGGPVRRPAPGESARGGQGRPAAPGRGGTGRPAGGGRPPQPPPRRPRRPDDEY